MHTHRLPRIAVAVSVCALLACTSSAPIEQATPVSPEAAPAPNAAAPAARARKGKAGKRPVRPPPATGACPDGVIASPSWPGEWPSPVVDVVGAVTVSARTEPCGKPSLSCTLPKGIYHPWSKISSDYLTVRSIARYKVLAPRQIGDTSVSAGDIVEVVQYLGEGFCSYRIAGAQTEDACPDLLGSAALSALPGVEIPETELFSITCEGKTAWVEANDALLALPEVRLGTTPEYGTVGPGTE